MPTNYRPGDDTPEKVEAAKSWGADAGVVYPRGPFDRDGQKKLAEIFKFLVAARTMRLLEMDGWTKFALIWYRLIKFGIEILF